MIKLKPLLLKMASLSVKDQKWLLKQLSPKQRKIFIQQKGPALLKKAKRFVKLNLRTDLVQNASQPSLPKWCEELTPYPPLYVAILMDQSAFAWDPEFIKSYLRHHKLKSQPEVHHLKPATKAALFKQWSAKLEFEDHLEDRDGSDH